MSRLNEHAVTSTGFIIVGSVFVGAGAGWPVGVGCFFIAFALLPNLHR